MESVRILVFSYIELFLILLNLMILFIVMVLCFNCESKTRHLLLKFQGYLEMM